MKGSIFLLLLLASMNARSQSAATAATGPNPQFLNNIYYCVADSLQSLEKTTGQVKNKMRYFGVGGSGGATYNIEGPRSAMRIKAGADTRFAVRLNGMMDPSTTIKLYRFDSQKKTRETSVNQNNKNVVDCNVQKSGTDVYILIPSTRLTAGEYAFQNMTMITNGGMNVSYTFFAFGVDQ